MATRILFIESSEKAAATLTNHFRSTGLEMERVGAPHEALDRLSPTAPDLILLHLRPPAQDAIDFVKVLRRSPATRALPVFIMTSAYRGARYAEAVRKLGVTTFLETPFSLGELLAAIRRTLPTLTTVAMPIHRHLRRAFLSRFSGSHTLHCLSGDKSLVFFEGSPIHLVPGFFHADLGRYLRHRDLISSQENSFFSGAGGLRHETLVQMGCLDYSELLQEKLLYLTEELIAAFGQAPVAATEQPFPCPPGVQPIAINVPDLFYQGYRRHADLPAFRRQLSALGYRYPGITANYHRFINFLSLTEPEKRFSRQLNGARTLRECLIAHPNLEPLILALSALGMIRFGEHPLPAAAPPAFPARAFFNEPAPEAEERPLETFVELVDELASAEIPEPTPPGSDPEPPAPDDIRQMLEGMQGKSYYELFGMSAENFTVVRLRDHYFHYTGQFGPNTLMRLSGEAALSAQDLLDRITTAYNTLADPVKRASYDELLRQGRNESGRLAPDRIQAQVQARAGLLHLERNDWDRAEQAFQEACNLEPFNGEWMAHLAWALYRNPTTADSRARRDKARQTINRALGLERTAQGHAYKGWMMLEADQNLEAGDEFTQALRFDARLELAREGLKLLEKKQEQGRQGGFRRIFKLR